MTWFLIIVLLTLNGQRYMDDTLPPMGTPSLEFCEAARDRLVFVFTKAGLTGDQVQVGCFEARTPLEIQQFFDSKAA